MTEAEGARGRLGRAVEGDLEGDPFVAEAALGLQREMELARAARDAEPLFARLRGKRQLSVHLGCGHDVRPGWVNIDLPEAEPAESQPDATFIPFDLRRGLPLDDSSCSLIYSSHFLGCLEYRHALVLMRDCHRVLEPGGLLRLSLGAYEPDFRAYLDDDRAYFEEFDRVYGERTELVPGLPSELRGKALIDYINCGVYEYGQMKVLYDAENVRRMLEHVGFRSVRESEYRDGLDPDTELRRRYSFYTEAVR